MTTVVVTGGSRGIGAATARRLAGEGWSVVVGYRGDADSAASVVDGIVQAGGSAVAIRANVSDEREVAAMFAAGEDRLGRIGGLVNAAGYTRNNDASTASNRQHRHGANPNWG